MTPDINLYDVLRAPGPLAVKAIKLTDFLLGTILALMTPPRPERDAPAEYSRILIIRPGGIGDAVFLLPILRILRKNNPAMAIDILCEERNAEVFRTQTGLANEIHLYTAWRDMLSLFRRRYDAVVDTEQWHYLSALTAYCLTASYTTGFATRPLRKKLFNKAIPYSNSAYELENFMALFTPLIKSADTPRDITASFEVPLGIQTWAAQKAPGTNCAISLGASVGERRLGPQQIVSLLPPLLSSYDLVLLIGGKDTTTTAQEILATTNNPRLLNFAGMTSLAESAGLLQKCQLVIGTDSGMIHLARALGARTIAIFGPGNPQKWAKPDKENHIVNLSMPCAPCTFFGYCLPSCRGSFACLRDITTERILQKAEI